MENVTATIVFSPHIQQKGVNRSTFVSGPFDPVSIKAYLLYRQINLGFGFIISLAGIVTNGVNLHTFVKMGLDDSVTISFFALACSDFLVCIIAFAGYISALCEVIEQRMNLRLYIPPFVSAVYIENFRRIFTLTTVLIITYLTIQRCLCVLIPFHVKGMFTKFKTYCVLLSIVTFSTLCYSLYTWRHQIKEVSSLGFNASQLSVYVIPDSEAYLFIVDVFLGIVVNISSQSINMLCLVIMFVTLRKAHRFRKSATTEVKSDEKEAGKGKTTSKETMALKQVTVIAVIFLLTNAPYFGYGIASLVIEEFGLHLAYHHLFVLVVITIMLAENINSSVNFFVYYTFNSKFRSLCVFSKTIKNIK